MAKAIVGIALVACLLLGSCDEGGGKGACVARNPANVLYCVDDVNEIECSYLHGTLHSGSTCKDLGY
jgi:hypothetical protein